MTTLVLVLTDDTLWWGTNTIPFEAFFKLSLSPPYDADLAHFKEDIELYKPQTLHLYIHTTPQHFSCQAIPPLSWLNKKRYLHQQLTHQQKNSLGHGFAFCAQGTDTSILGIYSIKETPLLKKIFAFLKEYSIPTIAVRSLPVWLASRALSRLEESENQAPWTILLAQPPHLDPILILIQGKLVALVKAISDVTTLREEFQRFYMLAQSQAGQTPPSVVFWGPSTLFSNFITEYHPIFLPEEELFTSWEDVDKAGLFHASPLAFERKIWQGKRLATSLSLMMSLILVCFSGIAYLVEHRLQCQALYWQSQPRLMEESTLPQGFEIQKAMLHLHDLNATVNLQSVWKLFHKPLVTLPPLHKLHFVAHPNATWELKITFEALEDIEHFEAVLKQALPNFNILLLEKPAFADPRLPYFTHAIQKETPSFVTFSIQKAGT